MVAHGLLLVRGLRKRLDASHMEMRNIALEQHPRTRSTWAPKHACLHAKPLLLHRRSFVLAFLSLFRCNCTLCVLPLQRMRLISANVAALAATHHQTLPLDAPALSESRTRATLPVWRPRP
jgi:hypothetical protein